MKKTLLAVALASSLISFGAVAADKAPEPDFTFTGNFGLFSDYRFRGISQTAKRAAIQGGFDFAHKSGAYLGSWNSNVDSAFLAGSTIEMDIYGGYATEIKGVGLNVGVLRYEYPGVTSGSTSPGTTEAYIGISYGPVSYKYSRSLTNYFASTAASNTGGTTYNEINLSQSVTEKIAIVAHVGKTNVANTSTGDYTDYKIGISYDLGGYSLGLNYFSNTGLNTAEKLANTYSGQKAYESGAVVSISKTF